MILEKWLLSDNLTEADYQEKIQNLLLEIQKQKSSFSRENILKRILSVIDLTTLEGSDTSLKIHELCMAAKTYQTAAVCIYPIFVEQAKAELKDTNIKVASVAGGFPSGQLPLDLKLAEIKYVLSKGVDEVDTVISRGLLMSQKVDEVADTLKAIHYLTQNKVLLKIILETGELQTLTLIKQAAQIAIDSGADFIKTSTGKIKRGVTSDALIMMCLVIREEYLKTGRKIGIKIAGGISDVNIAIEYFKIIEYILGEQWLIPLYFRIGASRLLKDIINNQNK